MAAGDEAARDDVRRPGEARAAESCAEHLRDELGWNAVVPDYLERVGLA